MITRLFLLALPFTLLAAACSSNGDDMPTDYAWMLTDIAGTDGTMTTPLTIPTLAFEDDSVSGNAYRPGDVIPTRKGLSVEIGNTDAEGRVILSDALTYASERGPDLVIDIDIEFIGSRKGEKLVEELALVLDRLPCDNCPSV